MLAKIVSIDEEFEKGRGPDKAPRKKRGTGVRRSPELASMVQRREQFHARIKKLRGY